MSASPSLRFPSLTAIAPLRHSFVLRAPEIDVACDREQALTNLRPHFEHGVAELGFDPAQLAVCEQVHSADIALAEAGTGLDAPIAGADGLISRTPGLLLGIYVADCCAVYLADRHGRAIALVHSGKKGTELGIAPRAIEQLADLGVPAGDLIVQLSPCIRPPAYEIDFAAQIRHDCQRAGVPSGQILDDLTCTSSDLERFYSYRVELGKTGRMLALMGLPA